MRRITMIATVALLLAACRAATPPAGGTTEPAPLGATPSGSPSASIQPTVQASSTAPASPSATPSSDPRRTFVTIGSVDDRTGDGGAEARTYNDIVGVRIQDDGIRARILVRLGAKIPDPMPEGEQMGIGVDLFRRATSDESDFQIFAAGTKDGWLAFLETPNGFADYDGVGGRFAIGGDIMEFTLPWSALGDLTGSRFSAFLDWDRDTIAIALAGQDKAPNSGRTPFVRES